MQQVLPALRIYFANSYRIRILLGALVAAIVADGAITKYLVLNGLAFEANPFLYYWVGEDTFLVFKLLGGLLASFYLWGIYRRHPRLSLTFASLALTAYTFIVFWNLMILWR